MPQPITRKRLVTISLMLAQLSFSFTALPQNRQGKPRPRAKAPRVTLNNELAKSLEEVLQARPLLPESQNDADATTPGNNDAGKPLADEVPLKTLLGYWRNRTVEEEWETKPTTRVAERLLAAAENRPWLLPGLLAVLPDEPATHDRIHRVWAAAPREEDIAWRAEVADWLQRHSRYLREGLIQSVRTQMVESSPQGNFELLKDLARLDWEAAQPMLVTAAPEMRTLIAYEHAVRQGGNEDLSALRPVVQALVTQSTDGEWKGWALLTLMASEWAGRDEWFASLFADPRLTGIHVEQVETDQEKKVASTDGKEKTPSEGLLNFDRIESQLLFFPLLKNPKELAPVVLRLVNDRNRLVHEGAVVTLAQWLSEIRRKRATSELPIINDVARALTPWLTNPSWADKDARPSYLNGLEWLKLPEALDGLVWILENDESDELRAVAANCLAAYRNSVAAPALRRALERTTDESVREKFITALYECGGFTDDEIAAALEAYARKMMATGGADEITKAQRGANADPLPLQVSIGRVVHESYTLAASEGMTAKLFERIRQLRRTNPPLAKQLLTIIQNLPLPIADQFFAERVGEGWIDADGVMVALARRDTMKKHAADALVRLAYGNGAAAGVATALLDNEDRARDLLKGSDELAQKALLACMRYLRDGLPVNLVAPLLKDAALEKFAERYLMVEDSRAAREIVWARHPREAMILGVAFNEFDFPDATESLAVLFTNREKALQAELKAPNAPNAIYAVLAGNETQHIEVRAWRDRAELRVYLDQNHWRVRRLSANEFSALQALAARSEIEDLGPETENLTPNAWVLDATKTIIEYLRISADGGRRILLTGLHPAPALDATLHETLAGFFLQLSRTGEFKISFALEKFYPELTVLPPDELYRPVAICGEGGRIQVLTEENGKSFEQLLRSGESLPEWREVTARGIGGKVAEFKQCLSPWAKFNVELWRQTAGNERALIEALVAQSLFSLIQRGIAPDFARLETTNTLLKALGEEYLYGLLTPDQQWLVAVRRVQHKDPSGKNSQDESSSDVQLIRYQVATKKVFPLSKPSDDAPFPLRWSAAHNKMLMSGRFNNLAGEPKPSALLDPATGLLQPIQGEFRPLRFNPEEIRELQPTDKPYEFWAAIYEPDKELTRFGRYDAQAFKFTPLIDLPNMKVGSSALWLDEAKRELWLVYQGNLVRIPQVIKTK